MMNIIFNILFLVNTGHSLEDSNCHLHKAVDKMKAYVGTTEFNHCKITLMHHKDEVGNLDHFYFYLQDLNTKVSMGTSSRVFKDCEASEESFEYRYENKWPDKLEYLNMVFDEEHLDSIEIAYFDLKTKEFIKIVNCDSNFYGDYYE